jgi:hemoglobin
MPEPEVPTIFSWAGGDAAFSRWLNAFYDLVEQDELIAPLFGGRVTPAHREAVTAWWCEVMGGPASYTNDHGGYPHMLAKHVGLAITPEQRLRFVTLLSRAADDAQLPADPELRAALMATRSGARGWRWPTRLPARRSRRRRRSRAGAGASPRPTRASERRAPRWVRAPRA